MKQIQVANLVYLDDFNGTFMLACYYSRLIQFGHQYRGGHVEQGPPTPATEFRAPDYLYMQDFLNKYIKTKAIWMCPSAKSQGKPDQDGGFKYNKYPWRQSSGGRSAATGQFDDPTTYMWVYMRFRVENPAVDYSTAPNEQIKISGSTTSCMRKPTKAMMFCEFLTGHGGRINMVYFDGHVRGVSKKSSEGGYDAMYVDGWDSPYCSK
jgi:prepilin-type processing-associated H-X9-DG protein